MTTVGGEKQPAKPYFGQFDFGQVEKSAKDLFLLWPSSTLAKFYLRQARFLLWPGLNKC